MRIEKNRFFLFLVVLGMLLCFQGCASLTMPPMLKAAKQGNLEAVKQLLDQGEDPDVAAKNGVTPLFAAAGNGDTAILEALIRHGANVNAAVFSTFVYEGETVAQGCTPLMAALAGNHSKTVDLLLKNGADVGLADINGSGPMIIAASRCTPVLVEKLIANGADVNAATTETFEYQGDPVFSGSTPLMAALAVKRYENAAILMEHGADVKAVNSSGVDALIIAAANASQDMVNALLEKGALPTAKVNQDFTIKGQPVVKGATALLAAADTGEAEIINALIHAGAEVDDPTENGVTPLMVAGAKGHIEAAKVLVFYGADVNARTTATFPVGKDIVPKGTSPLSMAALGGNSRLVQYLISRCADVNSRDDEIGMDPLFLAATMGHLEAVKVLIENGADVFAENKVGTAHSTAYIGGHMEIVRCINEARKEKKNRP